MTSMINDNIINFNNANYQWLRLLLFISLYIAFDYSYFNIPDELFINVIYYHGVVEICAKLINIVSSTEQVLAQQNHLLSAHSNLEIVRGCDGAGVFFLIMAAILVFPTNLAYKLQGLMLGIGLLYVINLVRIILLYFVTAYYPQWFQLIHAYLAPTFMIIIACCYFAWWGLASAKQNS